MASFLVPIVALLILVGVFVWAIGRAMTAGNVAFSDRYFERRKVITALPVEEAKRQAELLLANPRVFECVPAPPASGDLLASLAPELPDLFSRYQSIQAVDTESVLERAVIAPFGWDWKEGPWRREQIWQIGSSHEHGLILVKPRQEGIYDTDGMEDDLEEASYPSVYHWLLMAASDFGPPKA